ncbi:hypothetical protein D3C76_1184320 [compost metagenome]
MISSSPAWVLAAIHSGRRVACHSSRNTAARTGSCGSMLRSNLIEPVTVTHSGRAPSWRKRWASASVCTAIQLISCSISRVTPPSRAYPRAERSDSRALASATGMPRFAHWWMWFGHSSVSMITASFGRTRSRKRAAAQGRS